MPQSRTPPKSYETGLPHHNSGQFVTVRNLIEHGEDSKFLSYEELDLCKFTKEDFEFGSKLGKGKFGDVYLAREKKTNFIVAIKVLDKTAIRSMKAQKQIIREIKIHSYLNHPNIIKLYGVFHDNDKVYMIMEYAPDGELYKELKGAVNEFCLMFVLAEKKVQ